MSGIGELLKVAPKVEPEQLLDIDYVNKVIKVVEDVKRVLPVTHWTFTQVLADVLPFAMEFVSKQNASVSSMIPKLNARADVHKPLEQLSGGVMVGVYRDLVVNHRIIRVPVISYTKYSHSVAVHEIKEVKTETILADLRLWTEKQKMKHRDALDFTDILELSILSFLEKGFAIYSGVSFLLGERSYYRVTFLKGDMFVEMIMMMDDLLHWESESLGERGKLLC